MTTSLMANAPVVNGEFVNAEDAERYRELLMETAELNRKNRTNPNKYGYVVKFELRKRYRGPRPVSPTRSPYNRQSMCLKRDANAVSVYRFWSVKKWVTTAVL